MQGQTFVNLVQWVIGHGYFIFYLGTIIEGPLITAAAGVATALGYFNIYLVILIAVLGDLSADVVWYSLGYFGGSTLIRKYGTFFGLTKDRVDKVKKLLHHHAGKTMILLKVGSVIAVPGIIIMGSVKISLKKFVRLSLLTTLPKSTFFALLGLYSVKTYQHLDKTIMTGQYAAAIVIALVVAAYLIYKKVTNYIAQQIEKTS